MIFKDDALQIHWPATIPRLRARQVIYATKVDSAPGNKCKSADSVLEVLNELFPSASGFTLQLVALSYLIGTVVEFQWSNRDQRLNSSSFDAYIECVSQGLPPSLQKGIFDSLRKLASLLQDFCLFKLDPLAIGQRPRANQAYGIGTQQIQVGDVMIPLWGIKPGCNPRSDVLCQKEASIYMSTMLVVRCSRDYSPPHSFSILDDREQAEKGKIIGPAVCVFVEHNGNHDCDTSADTNMEEQCSMRLI